MSTLAEQFALRAKQREIETLQLLADRIEVTDLLGRLIHSLQRERGITSIYLGSDGKRFVTERGAVRDDTTPILAQLRECLALQLAPERDASARMLSLIAWVLLDLDSTEALRSRIDRRAVSAPDSVIAFSKIIAGLMELIFQLADAVPEPSISRLLVALVHVVQGKEAAGQERAVGAHMFAAATFSLEQQHRLQHLIGAQDRSLQVFADFAEPSQAEWWKTRGQTVHITAFENLRGILCTTPVGASLDSSVAEAWFDASSARITDLWHLQIALTAHVRQACDAQIVVAQQALRDSERLMQHWRQSPPPHTHALEHFFSSDPDDKSLSSSGHLFPDLLTGAGLSSVASLTHMLESQSARLASMEVELHTAKRALHERKLVERAKSALMARHNLSEEAAFGLLQKTSMEQGRRIVEVAEAALSKRT